MQGGDMTPFSASIGLGASSGTSKSGPLRLPRAGTAPIRCAPSPLTQNLFTPRQR